MGMGERVCGGGINVMFKRYKKAEFIDITQQEYVRGYRVTERGGWVSGSGYKTRAEMEADLTQKSAKLGGNAVIKFYWTRFPERRKDWFRGEGEAVLVERNDGTVPKKGTQTPPQITKKLVVIDGSNLIYWTKNFHIDTSPLAKLCAHLRDAQVDFRVYFDANIKYLLAEQTGGKLNTKEKTTHDLERVFGLFAEEIEIVPAGSRADDFILQRASISKGIVISNDRYADYVDMHPWLGSKNRLHRGHVSKGYIYIPTLKLKISMSG